MKFIIFFYRTIIIGMTGAGALFGAYIMGENPKDGVGLLFASTTLLSGAVLGRLLGRAEAEEKTKG